MEESRLLMAVITGTHYFFLEKERLNSEYHEVWTKLIKAYVPTGSSHLVPEPTSLSIEDLIGMLVVNTNMVVSLAQNYSQHFQSLRVDPSRPFTVSPLWQLQAISELTLSPLSPPEMAKDYPVNVFLEVKEGLKLYVVEQHNFYQDMLSLFNAMVEVALCLKNGVHPEREISNSINMDYLLSRLVFDLHHISSVALEYCDYLKSIRSVDALWQTVDGPVSRVDTETEPPTYQILPPPPLTLQEVQELRFWQWNLQVGVWHRHFSECPLPKDFWINVFCKRQ